VIRFQAPQLPRVEEVEAYFRRSAEARWYSNGGPCHELLVERLEESIGNVRAVPVASGTLGLMVALRALAGEAAERRREVLLPSFTFAATISAVLWAGFVPVFVDVEPHGWHLDPVALADVLDARGDRVAAVLACSTFGAPPPGAQSRMWHESSRAAGVPLLVDSAAGFGARADDGGPLGRQGDAEVFSFHATKPFAIGEGGLVTAADESFAARVGRLVNFGFTDGIVQDEAGLNAKLPEWSAATALAVLDTYPDVVARRRASADRMLLALEPHGYRGQSGASGAVWQFVPVLAPTPAVRARALAVANDKEIEVRSYYSTPLHRMPAFASFPIAGGLSTTDWLAAHALSLPMANDLSDADIEAITDCLVAAARAS
jgi:dTDP-4-amino-4,6-dideoxygalactose transaminase